MRRPQNYSLKNFDGNIELDFIGRFENLSDDFRPVCNRIGIVPPDLTHEIPGSTSGFAGHLTLKSYSIIKYHYAEEIELFDYRAPN